MTYILAGPLDVALFNNKKGPVGVVDLIFEKETFIVADVAPEGGVWPR